MIFPMPAGYSAPKRHRIARGTAIFLWVALALSCAARAEPRGAIVRVGLYQNMPKVGWSESGQPAGIFVDLLAAIAAQEGWRLEYVKGTWAEGLDRLATAEIDLMPDVAISNERKAFYAFHAEPVLSSWFQIFVRKGSDIRSLVDLDGKRIALLAGSIQQTAFEKMAEEFDLETPLLPFPDYDAAFAAVIAGQADAVVANRFYGVAHLRNAPIEDPGIIFHPTRLYFAAPLSGNSALLDAIDRRLKQMKQDHASVYYRSFERWTAEEIRFRIPTWLKMTAAAAGAFWLLSLAWSLALKRQVAARTRELQDRNDEIKRLYETVRGNEARFRSFVENANDIVYTLSPDGLFAYVSPNWPEILGHDVRDVVGKSIAAFVHPDDLPACRAALERARSGQKIGGIEYRIRHRDGTWRWHVSNGSYIPGDDNHAAVFLGIARDHTERKRTEERLRLHAQLLDSVRESVTATDLDGRILYWSRGAEILYGYSAGEVMGKPFRDFAGAVDPPDEEAFRREIAARGTWQGEHLQKKRNGETFWTSTVISLVADENGKPAGFVGIDRDITERKQAEDALRESQARFATLFDANPAGLMLVDRKTRLVAQVNAAAIAMIGLPADAIVGRVCHGFMCPAEGNRCPVCDLGQTVDRSERTLIRADGRLMPILKTVVPIFLKGRNYLLEIFIDLSERKKAQKDQEKLQAQLFQAQKMESVGRLAGGIAHDFNNVLGAILNIAELMLQDADPAQPHYADLEEIRKAAERAGDLTRQLLAFARQQTIHPVKLDLNPTVAGLLAMVRRLIGENIAMACRPSPEPEMVWMDPSQIDQILVNLCVNARDAIANDGQIAIETGHAHFAEPDLALHPERSPGDYAWLSVSDTGCGMDAETRERLFEPFFTTKEKGQGTGLGLATVYGIVKQNKGFIDVQSEVGRGSVFRIYLPRCAPSEKPA